MCLNLNGMLGIRLINGIFGRSPKNRPHTRAFDGVQTSSYRGGLICQFKAHH
jgi:hypothetical protein